MNVGLVEDDGYSTELHTIRRQQHQWQADALCDVVDARTIEILVANRNNKRTKR